MSQPTKRTIAIGRALMGYTADIESDERISAVGQHELLKSASKGELLAAKLLIEQYHPLDLYAPLLADIYINLVAEKSAVWSIAS